MRKNVKSHVTDNIDKLLSLVVEQTSLINSMKLQNAQLRDRLANIDGKHQYLEQNVLELEAKIGERDKRIKRLGLKHEQLESKHELLESKYEQLESKHEHLESKRGQLEKEMKEQLSSVESDKQYLEQQVTELLTSLSELDDKKVTKLVVKSRRVRE